MADPLTDPMPDPMPDAIAKPTTEPPRSSGRSSALVAAGIFLSRLLGLLRQSLIARYLGAGLVADAFNGAFRITELPAEPVRRRRALGVVHPGVRQCAGAGRGRGGRPHRRRRRGDPRPRRRAHRADRHPGRAARRCSSSSADSPARSASSRSGSRASSSRAPGIFVLGAWCLGILNSHRTFFLSYVAPVFWNLAMIGALRRVRAAARRGGARGDPRLGVGRRRGAPDGRAAAHRVPAPAPSALPARRRAFRPCARWCATSCPRS